MVMMSNLQEKGRGQGHCLTNLGGADGSEAGESVVHWSLVRLDSLLSNPLYSV